MKLWMLPMATGALLFAGTAWAPDILRAFYDPRGDDIVVEIAYRGLRPDHDFIVKWGKCEQGAVVGRLIDRQGNERAETGFRVTRRLGLDRLPCRPAVVTLRLGRVSSMSVRVPGASEAAPAGRAAPARRML